MKKVKISSLFHWLYCALALAPVFAVGSSVLVNVFNKDLTNDVNITYQYETNDVNSASDLVVGNIYTFNYNEYDITDLFDDNGGQFMFIPLNDFVFDTEIEQSTIISFEDIMFNPNVANRNLVYLSCDNTSIYEVYLYVGGTTEDNYILLSFTNFHNDLIEFINLENNFNFIYVYGDNLNIQNNIFLKTPLEEIPIATVDVVPSDVTNVFYKSVNELKTNPLFSWANDSFLVAPFLYIGNLFGVPSNSVLYTLLSYWLDISLIWLVFDVVMYVPLLVHRWLDRGAIE